MKTPIVIRCPNKDLIIHAEAITERTVQEVVDSLTDEQREVLYYLVGAAIEDTRLNG
jgi:hypothetical protein